MKFLPKVFIIILNYNGKDCLAKTLSDVFKIGYPNFETVLVDNNSTDGSLEMMRSKYPRLPIIKNSENLGFSSGNNTGIRYALERGADYVLLLNSDVGFKNDFLTPLIDRVRKNPRVGIASPVIFDGGGQIWFSGGKINWLQMKTVHQKKMPAEDDFSSDYVSGCAMLVKKEVFKKIGLLDEDYFLYWEDADFCVKAKKNGYELLVCPLSQIWHFEKSEGKKEKKAYWLVLSGLIFFKKNSPFWIRPWIILYTLARKFKNWRDIKNNRNPVNSAVQKAYRDFKYVE